MAPEADDAAGAGDGGGEGEGGEGEGGAGGADDAAAKAAAEKAASEKAAAAAKVEADAKAKADAAAKAKAEKGKKGGKADPPPKKTLLGGKGGEKPADGAGEKGKDGDKGAGADDLDAWTPELPEGQKADEELLGELKGIGKKLNLKGEQLQDVVALGTKMQAKVTQAFVTAHEEHVAGLETQARADKEIGGAKLEGILHNGLEALKRFSGTDFDPIVSELERTGLGSHPAFIKLLNRIHEATKEDDTVARTGRGAGGAPAGKTFTDKMYPKMAEQLRAERGETDT
jgi:hypothetical protein